MCVSTLHASSQWRSCSAGGAAARCRCRLHRPAHSGRHRAAGAHAVSEQQAASSPSSLASSAAPASFPWSWWWPRQAVAMFAASAVLGPLLDGMHSRNGVLHYADPVMLHVGDWTLETCWWVPVLFGVAGVIIGLGVPALDVLLLQQRPPQQPAAPARAAPLLPAAAPAPAWPSVLLCIALFVAQYGLSGYLDGPARGTTWLVPDLPAAGSGPAPLATPADAILAAYAALHFLAFDRTVPGLVLSVATAVGGPLIEVLLINGLHTHTYTHNAQVLGAVPLWIAWVYFCGGPAVGNLGRRVAAELEAGRERDAGGGAGAGAAARRESV